MSLCVCVCVWVCVGGWAHTVTIIICMYIYTHTQRIMVTGQQAGYTVCACAPTVDRAPMLLLP